MSDTDTCTWKHGHEHRTARQVRASAEAAFIAAGLTVRRQAKAIENELYKRADGGAACAELAAVLQE
jgi:hypothetical protein